MPATADVILAGRDGSVTTFNGVPGVKLRDPYGDPVRFSLGGGSNAALLAVLDGSVTALNAQDIAGLTELRDGALYNEQNLVALELPEGLTDIGWDACSQCHNLASVVFPSTLKTIGQMAFAETALTSVSLGPAVTDIGTGAFWYVERLAVLDVAAATPPTLGAGALEATALVAITVPAGSVAAYQAAAGWSDYAAIISAR